jgi:hypothetical protein
MDIEGLDHLPQALHHLWLRLAIHGYRRRRADLLPAGRRTGRRAAHDVNVGFGVGGRGGGYGRFERFVGR